MLKVPKQDTGLPPMGGPDPMMGDPTAGGGMPPMGDEGSPVDNEPPMGDGTEQNGDSQGDSSDQQELDDIFNNASIENKNAILKYARSQTQNDEGGQNQGQNDGGMPPMPNESRDYKKDLVNEIVNGIIGDMNDREGNDGIKRNEKKITNKRIKRNNPFVSGR